MARGGRLAPIALTELELERLPEALEGLGDAVAVEALVRREGAPVGWVRLPVVHGRCPGTAVRSALDHLVLPPQRPPVAPPALRVTVAICTRDRPEDLAR